MRSFFSAIVALAALLLAAVSVPAIWADRTIVDQAGFVAMAAPLGSDPEFQAALASATASTVTGQLAAVPGLQQLIAPIIADATQNLATDPGFGAAWTETLSRSHELTVVDPASNANDLGALNLDVAPMLQLVIDKVSTAIGQPIQAPQQVLISLGSAEQRMAIVRMAEFTPLGVWFAGGAVLAFALSLVIARRRSTTLALIGLGLAVVAGGWKLLLDVVSNNVLNSPGGDPVADLFKQQYVSVVSANFTMWIIYTLFGAALFILVGLLARVLSRRSST